MVLAPKIALKNSFKRQSSILNSFYYKIKKTSIKQKKNKKNTWQQNKQFQNADKL